MELPEAVSPALGDHRFSGGGEDLPFRIVPDGVCGQVHVLVGQGSRPEERQGPGFHKVVQGIGAVAHGLHRGLGRQKGENRNQHLPEAMAAAP